MNAFVILKIVLVIDLYVYIRDDQKHLVEANPGIANPFQSSEADGLPFLHKRARRSLRKLLNDRLSEFEVLLDAVSPDSHFSRFPEDFPFSTQQGPVFQRESLESTDAIKTNVPEIEPVKLIKRKSKKLTTEELAKKRGTNRKGKKKKMHRKKFVHTNSTTIKGQPFDIVVHIKVNET